MTKKIIVKTPILLKKGDVIRIGDELITIKKTEIVNSVSIQDNED